MDTTLTDFIVIGKKDPYQNNRSKEIKCFATLPDGNVRIPCRFNTIELTYPRIDWQLNGVELRPNQIEIMNKIMKHVKDEDDVSKALTDRRKPCVPIFINASTGVGKTLMSLYFASKAKGPILIITSSTGVTSSWQTEINNVLGVKATIASGKSLGKHDVCILSKQLASLNHEHFSDEDFNHYKVVICDEADTLCTQKAVNFMLRFSPRYLIGLSATIVRKDGLDKVLDVFWDVRTNWIKCIQNFKDDKKVTINFMHTGVDVPELKTRSGNVDWTSIAKYVSTSEKRMEIIKGLVLTHTDKKILISTGTVDYAKDIADMLRSTGVDINTYYKHSKGYTDASVIVTTVSKGGRGNDDKNLAKDHDGRRFNMMIMTLTKCDPEQLIGRLRADVSDIYILIDENSTMISHMKKIETKYAARLATINNLYYVQ